MATTPNREPTTSSYYSYVQDDTVDPPFNNVRGLNLDDERTQAVLCLTKEFANNYPRMDKNEMFTTWECLSINTMLIRKQPEINSTKDEVEHILNVSYQIFRDYCSLMCYGLHGVTENLRFNCKSGQVYPLMTKYRKIARTFYASHQATIQNFDLLRSIFLYTWDHYFGDEGVNPYVEVGADPLEIANDPPVNTSTWDHYLGDECINPHSEVGGVSSLMNQALVSNTIIMLQTIPSTPPDTKNNVR